jgi:hypothetical protein
MIDQNDLFIEFIIIIMADLEVLIKTVDRKGACGSADLLLFICSTREI